MREFYNPASRKATQDTASPYTTTPLIASGVVALYFTVLALNSFHEAVLALGKF